MNLTLEVTPAVERALTSKARRRGMALETYAVSVLEREVAGEAAIEAQGQDVSTHAPLRPHLLGKYAGRGRTVADFLREKHEEVEREEEKRSHRQVMSTRPSQSNGSSADGSA